MKKVYLKENLAVEPLINQWYAWPYLIPPAPAAMYLVNFQLKTMQSFISSPQLHLTALKNPAMIGGPFINYDESRTDEIKHLTEATIAEQKELLSLVEAIKQLSNLLSTQDGSSLEPLYAKVPEPLRGYVELIYDLNNYPSFRFIERLLYRSPYYKESAQSISLSLVTNDDRSFVFSTPRLIENNSLHLKNAFRDRAIDQLFQMKLEPKPLDEIAEVLSVSSSERMLFNTFFTEKKSRSRQNYQGEGVRIRYLGHACLLIESKNISILFDPVISYEYQTIDSRYTFADLPEKIDYVVITHNHQDHCMFETLLQLRPFIKNIVVPKSNSDGFVDPSLKLILEQIGFTNVQEIDELETLKIGDSSITGIPFLGEHGDLAIRTKMAYLLDISGQTIMCAADSNNIEPKLYDHVSNFVSKLDLLFIGMECDGAPMSWMYGPLLSKPLARKLDQTRRLNGSNFERAIEIVKRFQPKSVYVYAMGQEPWLTFLTSIKYTEKSTPIIESNKLVNVCKSMGIYSEHLYGCKEIELSKVI